MAVAISLPTLQISDEERDSIRQFSARIETLRIKNLRKEAYYEGKQRVRKLGIAIPPSLRDLEISVGWPTTVVDVLEERLDFQGWASPDGDPYGLAEVYEDNGLDVEAPLAHTDALIYGTSFVVVGAGFDGEPSPLVTIESPLNVTGDYDGRLRRMTQAFAIEERGDLNEPLQITLYGQHENVTAVKVNGVWKVANREAARDAHGLGRVQVVPLINRPRGSRSWGHSEITRAVRSYTDQGVRTLLGMEVNREFYSAPQRYALGADETSFADKDGNVRTGWELVMGRMLAIGRDEDGELPQVGEFTAASPAPYLAQMEGLAQLLAAEGAIPVNYLGFVSANPASADAIRAAEARLVKRAERRQVIFGRAWKEVARLAVLIREGAVPDGFGSLAAKWKDASTPTRAAAADEAVKLVGSDVLPSDSSVTYDRIGLSPQEQATLEVDKRRSRARDTLAALSALPPLSEQEELSSGGE